MYRLPSILLHAARKHESVAAWRRRVAALHPTEPFPIVELFLSPELSLRPPRHQELGAIAPQDRALALASHRLELIFQRPGGTWQELIRRQQVDSRFPRSAVNVCSEPLQQCTTTTDDASQLPGGDLLPSQFSIAESCAPDGPHLIHWTRAPFAAWNGESEDDYETGLLQGTVAGPRSAFDTLRRILREKTVRGSGRLLRQGRAAVCFSATPLQSYSGLRIYRQHLHRFDFEPYGLCVSRRKLQELGARPVIYGATPMLERLPLADQPFFQAAVAGRSTPLDWTLEREWRLAGDLDLRPFAAHELCVFVNQPSEADRLRREFAWPVICLNDARSRNCSW
jgi:hypothetical protein